GIFATDHDYIKVGAKILPDAGSVFKIADMIVKVKEPQAVECAMLRENQILFTYLHLAPDPAQAKGLMDSGCIAIAYETVQLDNRSLPLLTPMSEVAGRMSVQIGAQFLEKSHGGKGILLGGVPGVLPANVTIIGGGIVGMNAAKMAIGLGANVTIIDVSVDRLRYLDDIFGARIQTLISNPFNIELAVSKSDLVIGAVLIPGSRAPRLVTEDMVKKMSPGSVIIDVAIDQGGSIETIDRVTTHSNPTYVKHGVVHYAVANMPGAVARTSTIALTNATTPYAVQIASKGYQEAILSNPALAHGVNVIHGKITYRAVAEGLELPFTPLQEVLAINA
ncbi:MAG: alanine dehydrogenase, partial [Bacilli bacterium]